MNFDITLVDYKVDISWVQKKINEMKKTKKLVDGNFYDLDGVKRSIQIMVNNAVNRYNQYALNKRDVKKLSLIHISEQTRQ